MRRCLSCIISLLAMVAQPVGKTADIGVAGKRYVIYVGTYTGQKSESKGIYAFDFEPATRGVTEPELVAEVSDPSWIVVSPNQRFLYAVTEEKQGMLHAFSIDPTTHGLKLLNSVPSNGSDPCHLAIDRTGKNLLVANYSSGSMAIRRIEDDGWLGEQTAFKQDEGPVVHAHSMYLSPDNKFVLGVDLGLDTIFVYHFDAAKGTLAPAEVPPAKIRAGSGPRHLAFHPNGKFVYVLAEKAATVTVFAWEAQRGALTEMQTISTLPSGYKGSNSSAEVEVSSDGRYLYASNRKSDNMVVFSISSKGTLTPVQRAPAIGEWPRQFAIDPSGAYLIEGNQNSNNIVIFRVDRKTGRLTPTDRVLKLGAPVCFAFLQLK